MNGNASPNFTPPTGSSFPEIWSLLVDLDIMTCQRMIVEPGVKSKPPIATAPKLKMDENGTSKKMTSKRCSSSMGVRFQDPYFFLSRNTNIKHHQKTCVKRFRLTAAKLLHTKYSCPHGPFRNNTTQTRNNVLTLIVFDLFLLWKNYLMLIYIYCEYCEYITIFMYV